ncbi:hypothetical protein RUM43_002401 [Polyplax serrata]|uniref:Uncharacterized protein n=1 Tax=Polyplax serrata TaxID=468196 RepID=A0AAN8PFX7_POLSC
MTKKPRVISVYVVNNQFPNEAHKFEEDLPEKNWSSPLNGRPPAITDIKKRLTEVTQTQESLIVSSIFPQTAKKNNPTLLELSHRHETTVGRYQRIREERKEPQPRTFNTVAGDMRRAVRKLSSGLDNF